MPKERTTRRTDQGLIVLDEEEFLALNDDDEDDEKLFKEIYERPTPEQGLIPFEAPFQTYLDEHRVTTVFHATYLTTTIFDMLFYGFLVVYGVFQSLSLFIVSTLALVMVMALLGTATVGITKKFSSPMFAIALLRLIYDIILLCFSILFVTLLIVTPNAQNGITDTHGTPFEGLIFIVIFLAVVAIYLTVSGLCVCSSFMLGKIYREQDEKYHYVRTYNDDDQFELQVMNPPTPLPRLLPIPSKQVSNSSPIDPLQKPQTSSSSTTSTNDVNHQPMKQVLSVVEPPSMLPPPQLPPQSPPHSLVETISIGGVEVEFEDIHHDDDINVAYDGDNSSSEGVDSDSSDDGDDDSGSSGSGSDDDDDVTVVGDDALGINDGHQ